MAYIPIAKARGFTPLVIKRYKEDAYMTKVPAHTEDEQKRQFYQKKIRKTLSEASVRELRMIHSYSEALTRAHSKSSKA